MHCTNCGNEIKQSEIEKAQSSYTLSDKEINEDTTIEYVCPRCGHLVHENLDAKEIKSLSRAAHAELQRGRNSFAVGMGNISIGVIALVIGIIFFLLSKKPANQYQIVFTCPEFFVSMALFAIAAILLITGIVYVSKGVKKNVHYTRLLNDINNNTYIQ